MKQGRAARAGGICPPDASGMAVPGAGQNISHLNETAVPGADEDRCSVVRGVAYRRRDSPRLQFPARNKEFVVRIGLLVRRKNRLAGETATLPVAWPG